MTEERNELFELLDFSQAKKVHILQSLIKKQTLLDSIDISQDVYNDTGIDKWCATLPVLEGSKLLIQHLVRCPINNKNVLLQRQKAYQYFQKNKENIDFNILKEYEDDILWIYKLNDEIKTNNLINVLFPSPYIVSLINYIEPLLELYHMYKIYFIPLNVIVYPILSLFGPLYYLNRYLNFSISISTYLAMVSKIFKYFFTFTGNIKTTLIKIISISFYGFLFFYNIYQTLEYSYLLYSIKDTLYKKIHNLNIFIKEVGQLSKEAKTHIQHFIKTNSINETLNISNNFPSIYRLWKDDKLKDKISNLLINVYIVDILNSMSKQLYKNDWSLCSYNVKNNTTIWNMKNPVLSSSQVSNPVNLSKNIIMTGPNAAGKTTYVKSILSNIILAQTFGIVNALKADITLYDNIISFMRITDVLGSKSYFEAEAEYCMRMMQKAKYLSENNMKGLFLMDEPMHSTPPTEGMATAYAVAEYIGKLEGTTVILTTHFHKLVLLEKEYPQYFMNLSVEAHKQTDGKFHFPYKIRQGYSYQCIAIELLLSKEFPKEVIRSAINMKNKICSELVDKSKDVFN
jgi:hypothetical protein